MPAFEHRGERATLLVGVDNGARTMRVRSSLSSSSAWKFTRSCSMAGSWPWSFASSNSADA